MPRSEAILLTALRDTETNSSEGVRKLGLLSEIAENNRRLWSKCREERLMAFQGLSGLLVKKTGNHYSLRPREFCMIENAVAQDEVATSKICWRNRH